MIKYIEGDLLELAEQGQFDAIVHGCNCFNTMNSGIARQIREKYPIAFFYDCKTEKGDMLKLGSYTHCIPYEFEYNKSFFTIINAYTQYNYGTDSKKVDYDALTLVMRKINFYFKGKRIGLPKIGAGLAGGNWNIINKIIEKELIDCDVTVVEYKK